MASLEFPRTRESLQAEIAALEEDVRRLAYTIYELCGHENGHELDDWVFAEKRLKQGTTSN